MRVLLITTDFPPTTGGLATWYARLCAVVPGEVVVLTPQLPGANEVRHPFRVVRRWTPISHNPLARLVQIIVLGFHALRLVRTKGFQVVHIGQLHLSLIGFALLRLLGIPYLLYLHGGEMAPYLRYRLVRFITRAAVLASDAVIVNSTFTKHLYDSLGMSHPQIEKLTISVDIDRFRPNLDASEIRAKYGLDSSKVVLSVGRLVERKGHDLVMQALPKIPESVGRVRYLIVGSGPEEQRLRDLAHTLGCEEQVTFAGQVSAGELPYIYASCDVFAMPSRSLPKRDGVEGFGIVFLEAGACGKPVIAGRSGGMEDAVIDGVTGVLVDPQNPDELASAITRLLQDPIEAACLGKQGRLRTERLKVEWDVAVRRIWNAHLTIAKS